MISNVAVYRDVHYLFVWISNSRVVFCTYDRDAEGQEMGLINIYRPKFWLLAKFSHKMYRIVVYYI